MHINRYIAEAIGTFILVIVGSMALLASGSVGVPLLTVPFGFGLALLAGLYSVGHVSGGHFNPAVTLAMFLDKRTNATDLIGYWIAQFLGALVASLLLLSVTSRDIVARTATTFPELGLGILSEVVLTAVFVLVILSVAKREPPGAGIIISLTLVGVHFAGIPFSGSSVNPARSLAPAVVGGDLTGLWVYLVFPLVGGVVAYGVWRFVGDQPVDTDVVIEAVAVEETIVFVEEEEPPAPPDQG